MLNPSKGSRYGTPIGAPDVAAFEVFNEPWTRQIVAAEPLTIADGQVIVSDAPGLGLDLDWERLTDHPYLPSHVLRLYEDGWETRGSSPLDPSHGAL